MASAMLLLFSHGVSAVEQCAMEGEQPLEFRFFTDNNSWKDNGWVLQCEYENNHKEIVWEVPIGSLQNQDRTEVIREAACIPDTATCYLDIFDGTGDGLEGSKGDPSSNSFAGWFAFMHGATTIGTYKELKDPKFSELTYCVGPKCDKKPLEVQVDDEDCQEMVYLAMQLDSNPEDISYQLICGGEGDGVFDKTVIWDGKGFTKAGELIEEQTCLPKDACCEFIVVDSQSNGLTAPVDTSVNGPTQTTGFIYLETNYAPVLEYNGKTGETFGVLTKQFGCDDEKKDADQIVATEAVNVPEDEAGQDEEEEEEEEEDEEMEVEVGDNVPGVAEDVLPDASKWLQNYFGNDEFGTPEPSFETSWINTGPWTVPPTSVNWVSDDDYQNFNDDGRWFGQFNPAFTGGFLIDDAFYTSVPSTETSTYAPTSSSTSYSTSTSTWTSSEERDYHGLQDDVVWDDDYASWVRADDALIPPLGQQEIDAMLQNMNDNNGNKRLPWDPNAEAFLNGEPVYTDRKVGMSKKHKMVVTLLTVTLVMWSISLALYYTWERILDKIKAFTAAGSSGEEFNDDSDDSDDSSLGKPTNAEIV